MKSSSLQLLVDFESSSAPYEARNCLRDALVECLRPLELGGAKQDSFGELGVGGKYLIERQREDVSLGFVCRAEEQKVLRCLCRNLALAHRIRVISPRHMCQERRMTEAQLRECSLCITAARIEQFTKFYIRLES